MPARQDVLQRHEPARGLRGCDRVAQHVPRARVLARLSHHSHVAVRRAERLERLVERGLGAEDEHGPDVHGVAQLRGGTVAHAAEARCGAGGNRQVGGVRTREAQREAAITRAWVQAGEGLSAGVCACDASEPVVLWWGERSGPQRTSLGAAARR